MKMINTYIKFSPRVLADKLLRALGFVGGIHYIHGAQTLPPPLPRDKEEEGLKRHAAGDSTARQMLIVHNLRLVVYVAKKFEQPGTDIEDMISIGTIGLIKAINTFSIEKNIKLATYASRCIENEILMYLRKTSNRKREISIDEPLNTDYDGNELLLSDLLGTEGDYTYKNIEDDVEKDLLIRVVSSLGEREQEIMKLRFGLSDKQEHTQKEVADLIGISQSYISRLEKRIIKKMKKDLEKMSII